MFEKVLRECLTFDDVMLVPAYSEVVPADVDVRTRQARADVNVGWDDFAVRGYEHDVVERQALAQNLLKHGPCFRAHPARASSRRRPRSQSLRIIRVFAVA